MTAISNELVDTLKAFGLTEYEAKVYLALLRRGLSTAREVAEASGVPRPKVYETLERLVSASLTVVHTSDPLSYVPLPLDEFLASYKGQVDRRTRFLKESVEKMVDAPLPDAVINIVDLDRILDRIATGIDNSRRTIHLHLFEEEVQFFKEPLLSAHKRGVRLMGLVHGENCGLPGEIYTEDTEGMEREIEEFGRPTFMVFDETEALGGGLEGSQGSHAVYTRNAIIVRLVLTFLEHDVFESELERQEGKEFRKMLQGVREKYRAKP